MAKKTKKYRANNTYVLDGDQGDNPKLMAQALSDGRDSLYLEYYYGYIEVKSKKKGILYKKADRESVRLGMYLWQAPRTPVERKQNKETLELAKKIRFEKGQELLEKGKGYRLKKDDKINFLDYFRTYIDNYTKKDVRMVKIALQRFKDFLNETPEYSKFLRSIKPQQIDNNMMEAFTEYLKSRSKGEGARSIYQRFKKVYKACAVKYNLNHQKPFQYDDGKSITIRVDDQILRKDVLSMEEEQALINTHYDGENPNIRRAFILCLYCGLRFCDVKDLTFRNIDYSNKLLSFEQNKTKGKSADSGVVIPLNDGLLRLIGEPIEGQTKNSRIFPLPSYEMCNKAIKRWVKRAGIEKHISWHCARHSFAVNILNNGANIKTVSNLLGHSGLRHTEKYTRAIDKLKKDAINSLPTITDF